MSQRVPSELANLELLGSDGATRRLGDAWAKRPVALVFVRHFG
jgi:hypothetical protein